MGVPMASGLPTYRQLAPALERHRSQRDQIERVSGRVERSRASTVEVSKPVSSKDACASAKLGMPILMTNGGVVDGS
jgi:hypothetical protein